MKAFFFSKINEQCQWFVIKMRFKIQSGQYTMSPHKIKEATTNKKKTLGFQTRHLESISHFHHQTHFQFYFFGIINRYGGF